MNFFFYGGARFYRALIEKRKRSQGSTESRPTKFIFALAAILLLAVAATAQMTSGLTDAEIQGRNLAKQLIDAKPTEGFTNTGTLQIRRPDGATTNLSSRFDLVVTKTNWRTTYYADFYRGNKTNGHFDDRYQAIAINHSIGNPSMYQKSESLTWGEKANGEITDVQGAMPFAFFDISSNEIISPFAESDFWICDLGLEFFHWPEQKIIKKEFARGRGCMVLESTNPNPSTNGYSRIDCWIDEETLGIVQAKAYDANGKLLKEFEPKSFKKVNGQWELQDMEIRNVQTRSRSEIKFDLK